MIILISLKNLLFMCYNPIDIINPHRFVSTRFSDRFILKVPCGRCADCLSLKSAEWNFRLYYHALDCFNNGGFVIFDTLTYSNKYLPHISDYFSTDCDFPCFSSQDIRLFVARLRQRCKRQYRSNFDYFVVGEYGTSENHLHRPHYHCLFFVTGDISPVDFSHLVNLSWQKGRTDGIDFRGAYHVNHNTFNSLSAGALRSFQYVCKYIQKDSTYSKEINKRLDMTMKKISLRFDSCGLDWSSSSHYWRVREKLARYVCQFHRQSTHLGESALADIDLNDLFLTGSLVMPSNKDVKKRIPLPTYYKRKMFYDLVCVDGSFIWIPNVVGQEYLECRKKSQVDNLKDKFDAFNCDTNSNVDSVILSDYVVNLRGRIIASQSESSLFQRLDNISYYNYSNRYCREWFGSVGLSSEYLGNCNRFFNKKPRFVKLGSFIKRNVYFDSDLEKQLDFYFNYMSKIDNGKQLLFNHVQRLSNLVHHYFT